MSPTVTGRAVVAVSSEMVTSLTFEIVGASFTGFTVMTNVSTAVSAPSLTVSVIVAVPDWFAAGVTVTVRLAPLPPSTTLASGTSAVLDDARVTVSEVAAVRAVREFAVARQQEMGRNKGIVMDGRDIGTVVFAHAELKIFMTADEAGRVKRRYKELYEKNPNITLEEVKQNLAKRDYIDSHRAISPLRQAEDAIVLDNSHLSMKQQLEIAEGWVKERL